MSRASIASLFALLALPGACSDVSASDLAIGGAVGRAGAASSGSPGAGAASASAASAGTGVGGSAGTSQYANLATMSEIVTYKCGGSGCHGGETPPTMVGLSDAALYATLTTYVAKRCGNRLLVKAGAPLDSAFYVAQNGDCGAEMPRMPKGCVDNCTPPDYLEGIRQWIASGAQQH